MHVIAPIFTPLRSAGLAALCAVAAAGCGEGGEPPPEPPSASASPSTFAGDANSVTVRSDGLGKVLVDGKGRTLYLFEKDKGGKSSCEGECAKAWPPMTVSKKAVAGSGVQSGLLETTSRGGEQQVVYNDHPLYRYREDKEAGDVNGQNIDEFGGKWYVLDASGNKITREPEDESTPEHDDDGGY